MDLDDDRAAMEGTTRRRMLGRAGALAVGGALVPLKGTGTAAAAVRGRGSLRDFLNFTVTQEQFGVTAVTAAIRKAPGTPSEQFVPVLRAAVTTEFTRVQALKAIGARPLTGARRAPPNNVGFEPFPYKTTTQVEKTLTGLGIGYGKQSSAPGAFYEYRGDPVANGVGVPVDSAKPE